MEAEVFAHAIAPWTSEDAPNVSAQLGVAIRHAVSSGLLPRGERLPPERAMANALHVSRPTISAVIDDLRRAGYVTSRQGSGSWISADLPQPPSPIPFNEQIFGHGLIDLAAATAPDASLLPPVRVDSSDLLSTNPSNGLAPAGLQDLRADIAQRLNRWHPWVEPDHVVVTSGAHNALAMLVATLVPPGAAVLVEEVTYGGLVDLVAANGARPIAVARDANGVCPDDLRQQLKTHNPAMTVIVSSVHSPTGTISPDDRNGSLAEVLRQAPGHIVIDETYADLEFVASGRTLATELGSRCTLVGSLSKTAWLGLRTGWLASTANVATQVTQQRWSQFDLGPSIPSQLVAQQVLAGLDDLAITRRAQLIERSKWLTGAIQNKYPEWELTPVQGGLALWARLPGDDSSEFAAMAAERGVAVLTGSACRADRAPDPHLRLCFDRELSLLAEAVDRL